jgi:hypothetical protein
MVSKTRTQPQNEPGLSLPYYSIAFPRTFLIGPTPRYQGTPHYGIKVQDRLAEEKERLAQEYPWLSYSELMILRIAYQEK